MVRDSILITYMQCDTASYRIYATYFSSGTKREYERMFNRVDPKFTTLPTCGYEFDLFLTGGNRIVRENKPALFLGSTSYLPDELQKYPVIDKNGKMITRPLYLYFAVDLTNGPENNVYHISGKKGKFLVKVAEMCGQKIADSDTFHIQDKPGWNFITKDLCR